MGKPTSAVRARRLLALLPALRAGETLRVSDLAARVGATVAETAADLTTLGYCGIPPFTPDDLIELDISGGEVRVFLGPPALERPLGLSSREVGAITSALQSAGAGPDDPLVARLLAANGSTGPEGLARTVRTAVAPGGIADIHRIIAGALERREKVLVTHLGGGREARTRRLVHPHRLLNERGAWYLVGFCEQTGEERTFRLDRVAEAEATGEPATAPAGATDSGASPDPASLPVADVRFAAEADLDARDWPDTVFDREEDGSVVAHVPVASVEWLARRVVARLGEAEVLGPPEVRAAVARLAREVASDLAS